jgi:uncharacterized zinc-type alcohol dehydrogenase-like protein
VPSPPAYTTYLQFKPFSVVGGERQIIGSMIGGTAPMREMLAFSAAHKILPQVEVIDFADANKGYDTIRANAARYRMVLKIEGFAERQAAAAAAVGSAGGSA